MKQSSAIEDVFAAYAKALANGDDQAIDSMFSREDGLRVIGTDPREWWSGHDQVLRLFKAQFSELGRFDLKLKDGEAFEEGSVGWASGQFIATIGGNTFEVRVTTVLHQEKVDGRSSSPMDPSALQTNSSWEPS